jgi:hypothetical protein
MIDKFLFVEDLKGANGKTAQDNAFEELDDILDEEVECDECDEKDFQINTLKDDCESLEERIKGQQIEIQMLKAATPENVSV